MTFNPVEALRVEVDRFVSYFNPEMLIGIVERRRTIQARSCESVPQLTPQVESGVWTVCEVIAITAQALTAPKACLLACLQQSKLALIASRLSA